ncbi:MAG: hypothetical protein U1D55_06910 [Phycisphaerae bacterium]
MNRLMLAPLTACLVLTGCMEPTARLNAPPHGRAERVTDMQGTFQYMSDNALLSSMTVSDIHFLPNRSQLSDLGRERLCRLVALMESYGGVIRFNTDEPDQALVDQRTQAIMQFLAESGVDTKKEVVRRDMSGGRGMPADEAILIKFVEGSYRPKGQTAGAAANQATVGPSGSGAPVK